MVKSKSVIPVYHDINDLLASIKMNQRTSNPMFYCLRLRDGDAQNYAAPFKRGFYFLALLTKAEKTTVNYDHTQANNMDSFIAFQSPGLIYSFYRDSATNGYIVYFKPECFSFFKPAFANEFPFFDLLQTNFFKIDRSKFTTLAPYFEDVFQAYERSAHDGHRIASVKLLALLYELKTLATFNQWEDRFTTQQQKLHRKYISLINNYYIEKRTVEEYANALAVSAKHLSQSVKLVSGKNALWFINDRIFTEAKSLIRFTDFEIAEIAYQLNFSDPANFGKFFKKLSGITPLQYRNQERVN
jgi:AraC-like DNA-binding protein